MSERTLRLLIVIGLMFGIFIYLASSQLNQLLPVKSSEEGLLGGPIPGLTRWQLSKFEEGRALFRKSFAIEDGLGPLYNGVSCAECHGGLRTTGSAGLELGASSITRIAKRNEHPLNQQALFKKRRKEAQLKKLEEAGLLPGSSNKTAASGSGLPAADNSTTARPGGKEETAATDSPKAGKQGADLARSAAQAKSQAVSSKLELQELDQMVNEGGPVLLRKSITELKNSIIKSDCKIEPIKDIPKNARFHGSRYASQVYGLGLVDAIPDNMLRYTASQETQSQRELQGKAVYVPAIFSDWATLGRFGAKAQDSTLISFIAQEMATELGVSNQYFQHSITPGGPDKIPDCLKSACPSDPNDDGKILAKINFYLHTLAPPPRAAITPEATKGEAVFQKMGCAVCHLPQLQTQAHVMVLNPDGPPLKLQEVHLGSKDAPPTLNLVGEPLYFELRALENKPVKAYSDFLVHDMGAGLDDGIAQPGSLSNEWRTTPLWGLRHRQFYLHDGRAKTLAEAIALHGGQAAASAKSFAGLSQADKNNLLAFLNSL